MKKIDNNFKPFTKMQIEWNPEDFILEANKSSLLENKFYKFWFDYAPNYLGINKTEVYRKLKNYAKKGNFPEKTVKLSQKIYKDLIQQPIGPNLEITQELDILTQKIDNLTNVMTQIQQEVNLLKNSTTNEPNLLHSTQDLVQLLNKNISTNLMNVTTNEDLPDLINFDDWNEVLPSQNVIMVNNTFETDSIDLSQLQEELERIDTTPPENYIMMDGPLDPPSQTPKTINYTRGQLPPRTYKESTQDYLTRDYNFGRSSKKIGKRPPVDGFTQFEKLELGIYPQQLWPDIIATWKNMVIQKFYRDLSTKNITPEDMYKYLETTLGNTAFNLWQNYKKQYPSEYDTLVSKGLTPYNFVNEVSQLVTGSDPNMGGLAIQKQAYRDLEQLHLNSLENLPTFLTDFVSLASKAQLSYNEEIMKKLLNKIPDPLGLDLQKQYEPDYLAQHTDKLRNIISLAHWISRRVQIKCQEIKIASEIKHSTSFCKNVYLPQTYGNTCSTCHGPCRCKKKSKYKKYKKHYKKYKKHYALRKSKAKPPYLKKGKHVRQFKSNKRYTKPVICYICNEPGHTSYSCPRKTGLKTARTALISSTNMDLIEIDGPDLSDNESIYSVYSIIGPSYDNDDSQESSEEDENSLLQNYI